MQWTLSTLDYKNNDALREKMREILPVLKHMISHDVIMISFAGLTTGIQCSLIVANVCGKDEALHGEHAVLEPGADFLHFILTLDLLNKMSFT